MMLSMNHVVNTKDIAAACGVEPVTVRQWRTRFDDFPEPVIELGGSVAYDPAAVEVWLDAHGRKHEPLNGGDDAD